MELKYCFREDFSIWLGNSNHPKIRPYITHQSKLNKVVEESLKEILDILLREPLSDDFWQNYPEHEGKLSYSLPNCQVVPGGALRVDKEKMKIFLRDIKIEKLLQ